MSQFHFAVVQMNSQPDVQANLASLGRDLAAAAEQGATHVLVPENALFLGAREADKLAISEAEDGPICQQLGEMAAQYGFYLVMGAFPILSEQAGKVYQSSLVFDPHGALIGRYDKRHLFDVQLESGLNYRESKYFLAGDQAAPVIDAGGLKIGLSICYDLRFPELYRGLVDAGAQVLMVPAAFTYDTGKAHWEVLLRARAVENLCFVVAANQCGQHANQRSSWGHSMILDPWGKPLAQAEHAPTVISATLDIDDLNRRRREFPVLEHRRL